MSTISFGRWHNPVSNKELAAVRVTWYLDRNALARLLIAHTVPATENDLKELSPYAINKAIRQELRANGTSRSDFWMDEYSDEYPKELLAEEVEAWARRQVSKL